MPASSAPISSTARRWPGRSATRRPNWPSSKAKIASAAERALALELRLFDDLVGEVMARRAEIAAAAAALAALDVAAAHRRARGRRPIGCGPRSMRAPRSRSGADDIRRVEAALAGARGAFVANDCVLGEDRIWLVTGPNMAGKSTFLRQNALIAILAQIGAYRAGALGADRHRRSAVQPGRRGRRSGARPLDLHGRDGRDRGDPEPGRAAQLCHPRRDRPRHRDLRRAVDRLGGARASARGQSLPRAVRDALPRADRARREAAGARLPHDAGQGMAGRRRLSARGRARHRRPLLRHPCRQARRLAARRDGARRGGARRFSKRARRPARSPASPTTCRCSAPPCAAPLPTPTVRSSPSKTCCATSAPTN